MSCLLYIAALSYAYVLAALVLTVPQILMHRARKANNKRQANQSPRDFTLYCCGRPYYFGQACQFCEAEKRAIVCCEYCGFLCQACEHHIHSYAKHARHTRTPLSNLDAARACHIIRGCFRRFRCRNLLRALAKQAYIRFHDKHSRATYWYCKRTGQVTWSPPLSLRKEDFDILSPHDAARRIQSHFRSMMARKLLRKLSLAVYEREYDLALKRWVYVYLGRSRRALKQRWTRPIFLRPTDRVKIRMTAQSAAMLIQHRWRLFSSRKFLRAKIRQAFMRVRDPVLGHYCYWTPDGQYLTRKPVLLGSERWEDRNVMLWTVEEVYIFMRRLGLKHLASVMKQLGLDGALLLACEELDFREMGIRMPLQLKRIRLTIEEIHVPGEDSTSYQTLALRRIQVRANHRQYKATLIIQAYYRRYCARKLLGDCNTRYMAVRSRAQQHPTIRKEWYTELPLMHAHLALELPQKCLSGHGKQRLYRSSHGWGFWDVKTQRKHQLSGPATSSMEKKHIDLGAHISVIHVDKLTIG